MKIRTQSIHFSADQKLILFTEKKLSKLNQIYDKIISVDVTLKLENSGQVKDKIAEIKLKIPGSVLIAKETNKTFEESVDNAINNLKRQLVKNKLRKRNKDSINTTD